MIGKTFLRGLAAVLPLTITLAIIFWFFDIIEKTLGSVLKSLIGPSLYFPGLGVLVALVLVFLVGILINAWIVQKMQDWTDRILKKIPFIKTIYGSVCDLMGFFNNPGKKMGASVVMVEFGGMRSMGLVTRENFSELPDGIGKDEELLVYIPLSYQIGGLTVVVPRSAVKPLEMTVEQAMRFTLTAGIQINKES